MTDPRVVVVGGGLGGLATAARLAASGSPVTLLEQAERVGGKLGAVELGGFRFDTGPSLVTMPAVFERLFADTGAPLHDVLGLRRLDVAARYRFGDGVELDLPGERLAIAPAMDAALGDGAGAQWEAFLRHAERVWRRPTSTSWSRRCPRAGSPACRCGCATWSPSPPGAACAGWARATSATRAWACCSTATPPTPAPTPAEPPPRWPSCRTWSSSSGPGTCPAGCAGSRRRSRTGAGRWGSRCGPASG
ncbi:NAD(P)-binding protein [Actinomycetospora sp. CA-053990]|uniref:NAD(P)-binding protein n=1 Tax=Actinomycetospora sp. CA-053990 TaxID=3239891 RepID=UPI003D8D5689